MHAIKTDQSRFSELGETVQSLLQELVSLAAFYHGVRRHSELASRSLSQACRPVKAHCICTRLLAGGIQFLSAYSQLGAEINRRRRAIDRVAQVCAHNARHDVSVLGSDVLPRQCATVSFRW